jgi:YaiO family outer membrane protein
MKLNARYLLVFLILAVAFVSKAQTVTDSIVTQAKTNANKSDYDKAMESLDKLIKKWEEEQVKKIMETNTDSILKLANDAADEEKYNEAIQHVITVRNIWEERHQIENPPNTDSIFQLAIDAARKRKYEKAKRQADIVLGYFPERADVMVFKANIDAWEAHYDSANIKLQQAYKLQPENSELWDSWLNVKLWEREYKQLLAKADLAEDHEYDNKENLTLKRVYAYEGLREYDSVLAILDRKENEYLLDSTSIKYLYDETLFKSKRNFITAYYAIDLFENNNPEPQHLAYIDYGVKINKNTLVLRLNYANRFNKSGLQMEADYYLTLPKSQYIYLNYGFALTQELFPRHRAGAEYYFPLRKKFEASVGARYLHFTDNQVFVLTGHLGKIVNKFWFSLRPYFSFQQSGNYLSMVGNVRWYGQHRLNFWGVEVGYGNSPDERYILDPDGNYFNYNSYRIKLEKGLKVGKVSDLRLGATYNYEEIQKSVFRSRFTFEIIYKYRF